MQFDVMWRILPSSPAFFFPEQSVLCFNNIIAPCFVPCSIWDGSYIIFWICIKKSVSFWFTFLVKDALKVHLYLYKVMGLLRGPRWVIIWYFATATCIISQNGFCFFLTIWSLLQKSWKSVCEKWRKNPKNIDLHLIPDIVLYKWPLINFVSFQFVQTP